MRIPEAGEAKRSPRQEEEKEAGGGRRDGDEGFQHPAASPAALPRPLVAFQSHAGGREPSQLRSGTRGCRFEAVETTRRQNCRSGLGRLRPAGASLPLPEPRCVGDAAALPLSFLAASPFPFKFSEGGGSQRRHTIALALSSSSFPAIATFCISFSWRGLLKPLPCRKDFACPLASQAKGGGPSRSHHLLWRGSEALAALTATLLKLRQVNMTTYTIG